ncbi:MAG: glycosyltransferase [Humidesulfovibrio sp.]|nr:glycosyltransferase [Humidesulfovibrio sp.]
MDRCKRLCLIHVDAALSDAFSALGCEVLCLSPEPGAVLDLPAELSRHGFAPDLVLQQECLGLRQLVHGLHELDCVRLFWARDPHLNSFWQAAYARLFDLTFSTQQRWLTDLRTLGAGQTLHLPWYAPQEPFTPFAERQRVAGFVGRLGHSRPARTWLVELLREALPGGFEACEDLDFHAMLAFYRTTRLAPNESITGEVNFRLFEAAGCGCVVLAQDLGEEQAALFEPGREMIVCADALELLDAAQMLAARPRLAEALGRAAWERVQAHHLPLARAQRILEAAANATRQGADASQSRRWLALTQAGLLEAGRFVPGGTSGHDIAQALRELDVPLPSGEPDELVLAARLRVANALGHRAETIELLARCREAASLGLPLALTCSMAALRLSLGANPANHRQEQTGDGQELLGHGLALASHFARRADVALPEGGPAHPVALLLAWAERLGPDSPRQDSPPRRGGFSFEPAHHLPASAMECLFLATALEPGDVDVLRRLDAAYALEPGNDALRLGALSELGLRARGDWRVGLATGLCDLRVFRPGAGLSELSLAAADAQARGETEAFALALAAADPSGRIRRALAAANA